jgi:hypothetical protein
MAAGQDNNRRPDGRSRGIPRLGDWNRPREGTGVMK